MRWNRSLRVLLSVVIMFPCLLNCLFAAGPGSKLASISFQRKVDPIAGTKRVLVMMVSHESLKPSEVGAQTMQRLIDGVAEIFAIASNRTLDLESVVVPEPVLLPGELSEYDLSEVKNIYAAANQEVLNQYGSEKDSATFDAVVYFVPTDSNVAPFGMAKWKHTFGLRYTPAVVNVGAVERNRPEGIAHELGHALFFYAHAASADPETGEVLKWAGDPYDLMGYGLNLNLKNPPQLGMTYRYYWAWTVDEEITTVTGPGTYQLDPGKALLMNTNEGSVLWIEIIKAEQAYADEMGGLLLRVDRAVKAGIYHSTLDMTPATHFKADLHMEPGQRLVFEGLEITYVESIENENSSTPSAKVKVEGSGG